MKRRPLALLTTTIMLTTLAGCSTFTSPSSSTQTQPSGQQALSRTSDCCQSLAALPYQPLQTKQSLNLTFDASTPAHQFSDGKSFFHAFTLPRSGRPLTLQLTSPIDDQQVFAPTLLLLDESFQPVQRLDSDQFHYQGPSGFRDARLSGAVSVIPGPDAAYVVIYTSDQARQDTTTYENPEKAYARVRGLAIPNIDDPVATHAATGTLTLDVSPLGDNDGLLAPLLGHPSPTPLNSPDSAQTGTATSRTVAPPAPTAVSTPAQSDLDYRRMINAALKAGDIELALDLADRAERAGQHGTRAWLAKQLQSKNR